MQKLTREDLINLPVSSKFGWRPKELLRCPNTGCGEKLMYHDLGAYGCPGHSEQHGPCGYITLLPLGAHVYVTEDRPMPIEDFDGHPLPLPEIHFNVMP